MKVTKGAARSQGASEQEGVCYAAFICGMVMTLFLQPLSKLSASCLVFFQTAIFVLETKAHAMNYNHPKELSRNKRGLVRAEEVRRRNSKPHCWGKEERDRRRNEKLQKSCWAFDVSASIKPALATAGKAEVISNWLHDRILLTE